MFGKRNALLGLTVLNGIVMMAFFFVPPEAYGLMLALNVIGSLFAGPTPALVWSMYTDVADYGEWGRVVAVPVLSFLPPCLRRRWG